MPGSWTFISSMTSSAARTPMKYNAKAATGKTYTLPYVIIAHANGRAAKEPQVPGALGDLPAPNHVAIKKANFVLYRI